AAAGQSDEAMTVRPLARPDRRAPPLVGQPQAAVVRAGDTLAKVLTRAGLTAGQSHNVTRALGRVFNPRRLAANQEITLYFMAESEAADKRRFTGFFFRPSARREISVVAGPEGDFRAFKRERVLIPRARHLAGHIEDSLYNAAQGAEMPATVLSQLIRIFSFDVDFQREVQRGDGFEVVYDHGYDADGTPVAAGEITYAAMTLSGSTLRYYRFTPGSGIADYFGPSGQSVKKTLMRTPIDGARLSSGYGRRKHPILGYNKMHRGVDFAARVGTPIMAAGDGVIDQLGWNGAYGKYVRIRHNSTYKTAYAHLSRYRRGLKRGSRVRQGQTIGYVGSTGRSTGPHLHYEVLINGRQRNPMGLKLPAGEKLRAADLARFKQVVAATNKLRDRLRPTTAMAMN
ncbi:MAG: M23 family metallopeptidase, partial [Thalassobaculaceae bacterium]